MGIENLEFTLKLWIEEFEADPKKTTITKSKIERLKKHIDKCYAAHSRARLVEEAAEEFIERC